MFTSIVCRDEEGQLHQALVVASDCHTTQCDGGAQPAGGQYGSDELADTSEAAVQRNAELLYQS